MWLYSSWLKLTVRSGFCIENCSLGFSYHSNCCFHLNTIDSFFSRCSHSSWLLWSLLVNSFTKPISSNFTELFLIWCEHLLYMYLRNIILDSILLIMLWVSIFCWLLRIKASDAWFVNESLFWVNYFQWIVQMGCIRNKSYIWHGSFSDPVSNFYEFCHFVPPRSWRIIKWNQWMQCHKYSFETVAEFRNIWHKCSIINVIFTFKSHINISLTGLMWGEVL